MEPSQRPSDEDILRFENQIRDEQVNSHPLITPPLPIAVLREEYESGHSNDNFISKIKSLEGSHQCMRKTRGDGNCFFRAFSFAYVENICRLAYGVDEMSATIDGLLKGAGFDPMAYEDFLDELKATAQEYQSAEWLADLWDSEPHRSHSLVVLFRLAASAFLRGHAEEYAPFIWETDGSAVTPDMVTFCQRQVECMGIESDQIHIIALGKAMNVDIRIAYLDGSDGPLSKLDFPATGSLMSSPICIEMLYRPGHYDLLYAHLNNC